MSKSPPNPTLFVTTGMEKSGNTWSEMMLWSMPGIGGFATCASRGLPATVQYLRRDPALLGLLEARGCRLGQYLSAMLGAPLTRAGLLPESDRPLVEAGMEVIRRAMLTMKDNFYAEPNRRTPSIAELVDRLMSPTGACHDPAIGAPTKHVPPHTLRDWLPGWKIVQFLRDPRDVIVSLFYHDLVHLDRFEHLLIDTERVALRSDWKPRYFGARKARLEEYFADDSADPQTLIVRYEDTLADAAAELCRISCFLGVEPDEAAATEIAERYAFRTVTGGTAERRNSSIRKGRSGDWRRYLDRELVEILGKPFVELVTRLGYEPDDGWVNRVPEHAEAEWDFSRFRRRTSTVNAFMPIWYASEDLHERYPIPTDLRRDDNFFVWLEQNASPDVQRWLDLTARLSEQWQVDIIDNQYH